MSRLKQNRIIDNAIDAIAAIAQNQCSLSDNDLIVVNEALSRLETLRCKKGKTNEQIRQEIVAVFCSLNDLYAPEKWKSAQ